MESAEPTPAPAEIVSAQPNTPELTADTPPPPEPGSSRELLRLAAPLILSQSFMTIQVFVDTVLLARHDALEMAASFPAVMWFWLPFGLLQVTAGYTSTFVAQYTGAGRSHRVGPAVWQGIHFAVISGILFMAMVPAAPWLIALGDHSPELQRMETAYLQSLSFAALPMLVMSAINGFFSGRSQTWTVLGIEAVGTAVNVVLALLLIFGYYGFPEMGIVGAGIGTVCGSWASAAVALALLLQEKYRREFNTLSGWHFERPLFARLMKYGGPAGMQLFLDVLVFNIFVQLVGRLGDAATGATTLTIRLNMIAILPMLGVGQAICILVGQRLGGNQPEIAEKTTWTGLRWMFGYMCVVSVIYLTLPGLIVSLFKGEVESHLFAEVEAIVPKLLICVAVYSLADALNLSFAFALRGAGDTRFVTALTFCLAWPIMVIPTWIAVKNGASVYWAWVFASAHIFAMSVCFFFRFRSGKWKTMRVIEPDLSGPEASATPPAPTSS